MREIAKSTEGQLSIDYLLSKPQLFNAKEVTKIGNQLFVYKAKHFERAYSSTDCNTFKVIDIEKDKSSGAVKSVVKSLSVISTDKGKYLSLKKHETERVGSERKLIESNGLRLKLKVENEVVLPTLIDTLLQRNFLQSKSA